MKEKRFSRAMTFIILFGIVSLFSDMTHEGASSIRGAYLALLGASAGTIGFISGLGELIGYSMRYVFGKITDRTRKYWPMVIFGYILDILAVPALALVGEGGWIAAAALLVIQRMGKAIKKPAKDTIMSFAASQEGVGKSFGIQEMLDQIGAFLGPVFLYLVMLFKTKGTTFEIYRTAFAFLAIPGLITILLLFVTKGEFPNPESFEPETKKEETFVMKKSFIYYIFGISLFAFGFMDYALVIMHISKNLVGLGGNYENFKFISQETLPLLYAGAMLVDALAALVFGHFYDKKGVRALVISTIISAPFSFFIFGFKSELAILFGLVLWGIGMGAQESILKAAVTSMVPKKNRATGYGIFECSFGIFWFLGSWLLGLIYSASLPLMIGLSILAQLMAIPFYLRASRAN
ncbi:MAG: MFS transporter [Peptoniphilus harei]|uniref:Transporter, major facilitator family protein n=1 Tax=Peptoniphilus harei ACS-146-V-Sch2b TaxID=908338 RepID=E4KX64_9FIRM|nr:MFS transporter [Peptoniphilus harei]EFR33524.1 transporter, major facilitator family protein [Peptoniphilus harei ACS-146-V-Sch2b]MDK7754511.1 MFS transporter [Peptoniphilus harei]MDK7760317.1 MFS transporter [Peptoniphilus harei]MDK8270107.1 MFS transporter [Peptoniphilus harei]MDK8338566.1 MFS transporter [Peptoniphilus harei]